MPTVAHERRSQLYRIVASKGVALREVSGEPDQVLGYGRFLVGRPPLVQSLNHVGVLVYGEALFPQEPGKGRPCFHIGDYRGRDPGAFFDSPFYKLTSRLPDVDLDQGRGIEVEDQRRSSSTISAAVFSPLMVGASSYIGGITPDDWPSSET